MIEKIEQIIKMFEKAKISKLDLEFDNIKIKLEKEESTVVYTTKNESISLPIAEEVKDEYFKVSSPLVGTFYAQKDPKLPPLVNVGDKVKKGDLLCIIEAMKIMNEIRSPRDGIIKEVLVENEQLVEYNQNLFSIGDE